METGNRLLRYLSQQHITPEQVLNDYTIQWTITTPLYNIGEHTYYISKEMKFANPDIPWSQVPGLRHRLVHNYDDTNWSIIDKREIAMNKIHYLEMIANIFEYKTIYDLMGNEYVVFKQSSIDQLGYIEDKTEFESIENHVHLLDRVQRKDFATLSPTMQCIGKALLRSLTVSYPNKHFCVYVTLRVNDSLIVRFHQKWANELPYYNPEEFDDSVEKVFMYSN